MSKREKAIICFDYQCFKNSLVYTLSYTKDIQICKFELAPFFHERTCVLHREKLYNLVYFLINNSYFQLVIVIMDSLTIKNVY